jgi:ribulose-phosphate 3-epimerase
MVKTPIKYIRTFTKYPLNSITFHPEAVSSLNAKLALAYLKHKRVPYGIAIKPHTDVNKYVHVLKHCSYVLIMGVEPGFGGQSFMPITIENLKKVNDIKKLYNPNLIVQLDGGVNTEVLKQTLPLVDHYIIGTFLIKNLDNAKIINELFMLINS